MDKWVIFISIMVCLVVAGGILGVSVLGDAGIDPTDRNVEIIDEAVPFGALETVSTISIVVEGSGTVGIIPYKDEYTPGERVKLTAFALEEWKFSNWEGAVCGEEGTATIILEPGENQLNAVFVEK